MLGGGHNRAPPPGIPGGLSCPPRVAITRSYYGRALQAGAMFSRKQNAGTTKRAHAVRPLHDLAPHEDDESPSLRSAARRAKYHRNDDRAGNAEPAPGAWGSAIR